MNFEFDILHAIQSIRSDVLDSIMLFITRLGDAGVVWIIMGILLLAIPAVGRESKEHLKERRMAGLMLLLSMLLTLLCVNIALKNIVQRLRPFQVDTSVTPLIFPGETSFPSGHTAHGFTAATAIFLYRKKAGIAAYILASVIAFSRMYLFVHFPTDILGGTVAGILCALVVNYCFKKKKASNI